MLLLEIFRKVINKARVSRGLNSSRKPAFRLISGPLTLLNKESKLPLGF